MGAEIDKLYMEIPMASILNYNVLHKNLTKILSQKGEYSGFHLIATLIMGIFCYLQHFI